uniref:PiggyBac transposable element-derived protein 4 C-terminal zinc-ribbon domain-containing protein n=1 Tax=Cacopsylla melanoneura TaxID=428564 RepID=A0A8D9B9W5_9HEMI
MCSVVSLHNIMAFVRYLVFLFKTVDRYLLGKSLGGVLEEDNLDIEEFGVVEPSFPNTSKSSNLKKRCHLCPNKIARKTKTLCGKCEKNICSEHSQVVCLGCM